MEEVKAKRPVSVAEVKDILGKSDPEDMDQIQRWTFDYAAKFAPMDGKEAKKARQRLVKECELTEEEAVEIVNICPMTIQELRAFTFGWKKLIMPKTLEDVLKIVKEHA